jgi:uncharacterized protein YjiS (DUF1127 family)|eukprot:CAMPEP_0184414676 /NCGR_PEP_ID=MMETSP0738-20130409/8192_1 /TAXON_ID=385413 /ORGANISM="Thalassiosira miniscula, Strain CCMP1093" /LENGTH=73 /DNA_ID=CAMNT_0026773741 /DNA_START=42 /DNA_END=263 /DNA_ORIENTATION=-
MTFVNYTRAAETGLGLELASALHHLMQRFTDYRVYRKTLAELRALDDRTLADLGIPRCGVRAEALRAVYGLTD